MPASLETVEAAALQLTPDERAQLIERLIDTMLPEPPLHPDWSTEIARRVAELDAGLVEAIPTDAVFAKMRAVIAPRDPKP